jgi:hypothetical protein
MANATLTVANSVLMIVIPDLFPVPQQLQGYATDDVFSTEAVDSVETIMGVDGLLSGGWMPTPKRMTIILQADSASTLIFDVWQQAQEAVLDAFLADMLVSLPSLGRSYACTKGFLTSYTPMPDARKVLQPRRFQITWQSIIGAPL